ncbi:hypothetical protein HMPREF3034_00005 [Prevotella sp. DNF00663]|nr:hypothetical protein HMPREF3034_00005 [Prevotella sp. DNF00663]
MHVFSTVVFCKVLISNQIALCKQEKAEWSAFLALTALRKVCNCLPALQRYM